MHSATMAQVKSMTCTSLNHTGDVVLLNQSTLGNDLQSETGRGSSGVMRIGMQTMPESFETAQVY